MADYAHPEQQAFFLRAVAERMGLSSVREDLKAPDVLGIYRLTIYYHDRRALDSCATLIDRRSEGAQLSICYRGLFNQTPIVHAIPDDRYQQFVQMLQRLRFDHIADQPRMPLYGLDFWMIERGAGGFVRSVIVAPQTAEGVHADLVNTIKDHLPEALRAIPQE